MLEITIKKSKTDPFRETAKLTIARSNSNIYAIIALLHICSLDSSNIASHTFCIGAATSAGAVGLPDWLSKVLGSRKSNAYQTYIKTPKEAIYFLRVASRFYSV